MNDMIEVRRQPDGLVWLTINRADKHNALARAVLEALALAVGTEGAQAQTRVIMLRGAGEQYFAAGGDLVELAAVRSPEQIDTMADHARGALDAVRDCPVPVIAWLNGDAIGGGAELALACDLRVLTARARIGFIQGRMGISPAWGGGPDLCQLVGPSRALRMMSRCEMIPASLALQWGLADLDVTDGPEGTDFRAFVQPMLERSRAVLQADKALSTAWRTQAGMAEARALERQHLQVTWASDEHWNAVHRFLAKDKKS